ncbi:hypothetical protein QBC39DRAFT_339891 [Podospora conica]|nr:hypothetical protein QBC39DRAFT_339891 [Schizothecium conicum]
MIARILPALLGTSQVLFCLVRKWSGTDPVPHQHHDGSSGTVGPTTSRSWTPRNRGKLSNRSSSAGLISCKVEFVYRARPVLELRQQQRARHFHLGTDRICGDAVAHRAD